MTIICECSDERRSACTSVERCNCSYSRVKPISLSQFRLVRLVIYGADGPETSVRNSIVLDASPSERSVYAFVQTLYCVNVYSNKCCVKSDVCKRFTSKINPKNDSFLPPSSVVAANVATGPSPFGLKTRNVTKYSVYGSKFLIV
ncbi:hypothetical protein DERP_002778 [Dermatophagoides pteronyssinus]|uniref:Uncharacterized protein n=1 Tax=Dermatophagoides pteronyssinus TaxID=6956 RepID=A0ABQ8JVM1_DERPT|nr:hypothetical protein DERP_002778 [Dermatophagoides pteronyssinus]